MNVETIGALINYERCKQNISREKLTAKAPIIKAFKKWYGEEIELNI